MTITLTDGGIETRIIYEFKYAIGDCESFELLEDESGRDILRQIYQSYADVGVRYGLPIQLGTPTWRAVENGRTMLLGSMRRPSNSCARWHSTRPARGSLLQG